MSTRAFAVGLVCALAVVAVAHASIGGQGWANPDSPVVVYQNLDTTASITIDVSDTAVSSGEAFASRGLMPQASRKASRS